MKFRDELIADLKMQFGALPGLDKLVDRLIQYGAVNEETARTHYIASEFFRRLADSKGGKNACDVEQDLSAETGLSERHVRRIRTASLFR